MSGAPDYDALVAEYVDQTAICSLWGHMKRMPAYAPLAEAGAAAVPALLRALERRDGGMNVMHALHAATGEWPAASAQSEVADGWVATNVSDAVDLWLAWGRERGHHA